MKKYSTSRFLGLCTLLLSIFLTTGSIDARAQAGFSVTSFILGPTQSLVVCPGSGAINIDTLLTIYDIGPTAFDTWWVYANPIHGSLSLSTATSASTGGYGGLVYTSGWTYLPVSGFIGMDSFTIYVNNGTDTALTHIYVTINPSGTAGSISGPTSVCVGGTVALSDTPSGGTWMASGSASSVSGSGVVMGLSPGTNTIMYIISNSCGTDTAFLGMAVVGGPPTPVATITGSTNFCAGGSCTFSVTPVSGLNYQWFNGSGAIPGATGTSYTATTSDNYYVSATNSTGCSSNSATTTVVANPIPSNTISAGSTTTFCIGGGVTLNTSAGFGYYYQWSDGGTPISGATGASYTATTSGSYTVLITNIATGCNDNTASPTVVVVNPAPSGSVTASGALTFCPGGNVTFSATSGTGYSWQWYNGASIIIGATNVTYTTSAAGNYYATITNSYGCPVTSSTFTVTLYTAASVSVSPTGATTICYGDTAVLTATTASGTTYQWYNGYTAITGATSATYNATTPGTYSVIVTNGSGCSAASATTTISYGGPTASITASGSTVFCSGSVTLYATTGTGYTWQWYNGGIAIAGATTSAYTTSATGSYTVRIGDASGCASLSPAVSVTNLGSPTIAAPSDTTFCAGGSAMLAINTPSSGTSIFQWRKNSANITGATNRTYAASTTGVYTCYENVGGTCIATTPGVNINVRNAPVPVISYSGNSLSTTAAFSSYQWKLNGVAIPGATIRTITAVGNGAYNVVVADVNTCEGTSAAYVVSGITGINNVNEIAVRLYPNPATNMLHIDAPANVKLVISSMDGKIALQYSDVKDADISALANGVYVVTVYDNDGNRVHMEKLIKQ